MGFLDFLTGKKSYMHASFATDQWRSSLPPLTFGPVFGAIHEELLWVLESTIKDEELRTATAENLAKGVDWYGNECLMACIANTHLLKLPSVRGLEGIDNYDIMCIPTASVSELDQQDFMENVKKSWDSLLPMGKVKEYLDLAITRWYATESKPGTLLVIELKEAGKFFVVPKTRSLDFIRRLGLQ